MLLELSAQLAFYGNLDYAAGEGARFPAIKVALHSVSKYTEISKNVYAYLSRPLPDYEELRRLFKV